MKNIMKSIMVTAAIVCILITLYGCNGQYDKFSKFIGTTAPSDPETVARQATNAEDQWEYLVVSFGETAFGSVEENIKNGNSKLVAFQEFADLLSGYEGIDLEAKLDLLGRFGWELVDTIGQIRGDQQLLMKRQRIANRIQVEQEALKTLSVILQEESDKKKQRLKDFMQELDRLREKQETASVEGLVELDTKEKMDRELEAKSKAVAAIRSMFLEPPNSYVDKTKIKAVDVVVSANENERGTILYSGSITITVDATDALLFDINKYRASQADKLLNQFKTQLYKKSLIFEGTSSGFYLNLNVQITHEDKVTTVARSSNSVSGLGYKSLWDHDR